MSQTTLADRPYVNSGLFSGHYLDERVRERDEWACDEEARTALAELRSLYDLEGALVEGYSEDPLIDNWIAEVLDILGFGTQVETTLPGGGRFVDVWGRLTRMRCPESSGIRTRRAVSWYGPGGI